VQFPSADAGRKHPTLTVAIAQQPMSVSVFILLVLGADWPVSVHLLVAGKDADNVRLRKILTLIEKSFAGELC
jgi:hypothetical protein